MLPEFTFYELDVNYHCHYCIWYKISSILFVGQQYIKSYFNAFFLMKVDTHSDVYVELWDEDLFYDDLLGSCSRRPTQGTRIFSCSADSGVYEFKTTLTCDSHLTGDWCHQYIPSP